MGGNIRNIHSDGWNNSQVCEISGMNRINTWVCMVGHNIWDIKTTYPDECEKFPKYIRWVKQLEHVP